MTVDDTDPEAVTYTALAPGGAPAFTLNTVLELLADTCRRFVLYALVDSSPEIIALESLFDEVVPSESAIASTPVTRDRYLDVAADLCRWHRPVLADVGVIEWDERSTMIR